MLEGEVAEGPNGVFRLQRVHREIGAEPATVADGTPAAQERLHALDHVVVTGVDPGQVLAFSAVTALGQRWRRENAADFAANPPPEGEGVTAQEVSGADYRIWAKSVRNEQGEAQRRGANQAYSDALAALADRHTRTGRYQVRIAGSSSTGPCVVLSQHRRLLHECASCSCRVLYWFNSAQGPTAVYLDAQWERAHDIMTVGRDRICRRLSKCRMPVTAEAAHQSLKCRSGVMCAFICSLLLSLRSLVGLKINGISHQGPVIH